MAAGEQYRLLMADVYELAGLSRRTSEAIARELGQTVARWHVLSVLSAGPCTVPATARRLGLTRQGVQRVADDLLAARLLTASPNPDHARSPLLTLTNRGQLVLEQHLHPVGAVQLVAQLPKTETGKLTRFALRKIAPKLRTAAE